MARDPYCERFSIGLWKTCGKPLLRMILIISNLWKTLLRMILIISPGLWKTCGKTCGKRVTIKHYHTHIFKNFPSHTNGSGIFTFF